MDVQTALNNLAIRMAQEVRSVRVLTNGNNTTLDDLTTTNKTNLIAAINEVNALITASSGISDSTTGVSSTWSSSKITTYINTELSDLLGGVSSAFDTLLELQVAIQNNTSNISSIVTSLLGYARFDTVQTLSLGQKNQICTNIGIGNPETNFVAIYNSALV